MTPHNDARQGFTVCYGAARTSLNAIELQEIRASA